MFAWGLVVGGFVVFLVLFWFFFFYMKSELHYPHDEAFRLL